MEYFQPEIIDIRIGWEGELLEIGGKLDGKDITKEWVKYKVEDSYDFNTVWDLFNEGQQTNIRCSYLTKEQIENEGWVISNYHMVIANNYSDFKNNETLILIKKEEIELVLNITKRQILINGKKLNLPSINEFRYLTKLISS